MIGVKIALLLLGFMFGLIFGKIIFEQEEPKSEKEKRLDELTDRELSRVRNAIDDEMLRRLFGEDVKQDDGPFEEFKGDDKNE